MMNDEFCEFVNVWCTLDQESMQYFFGKIVSVMNKSVCDECKLLSDFFYEFVNVWWTIWSGICAISVSFRLPAKFKHVVFCENSIQSKNLRLIQCEYLYMAITSFIINHFWNRFVRWCPQTESISMVFVSFVNLSFVIFIFVCSWIWYSFLCIAGSDIHFCV